LEIADCGFEAANAGNVKQSQFRATGSRRARPALQDAQRAAGGAGQAPVAGFGSREHQTNPICSVFGLRMGVDVKNKANSAPVSRGGANPQKRDCFGRLREGRLASLLAMTPERQGPVMSNKANPGPAARDREARNVKRTQFPPFWSENEGRRENEANPARVSPGGAGRSREIRNPKLEIRKISDGSRMSVEMTNKANWAGGPP